MATDTNTDTESHHTHQIMAAFYMVPDTVIGNDDNSMTFKSRYPNGTKVVHIKFILEDAENLRATCITVGSGNGKYIRKKSINNPDFCPPSKWVDRPGAKSYICTSGLWTQTQLYRDAVADYEANH